MSLSLLTGDINIYMGEKTGFNKPICLFHDKRNIKFKPTSEEVFEFITSYLSWSALFAFKTADCQSMIY